LQKKKTKRFISYYYFVQKLMEEESGHKEEMKGWRAIVLGGTGATGRVRAPP
jgi:hypothetical protein